MKKIFLSLAWLCIAAVMFTSCLGDNEDEYVSYSDTAISSFALGTMNCYLHTTSSMGVDSVYKVTYSGSAYKFYIDHINRTVYNPDSLPYGTDAKHVICIITAKNSGYLGIKSLTSDSIQSYNSSDSIDFTSPRIIVVASNDLTASRNYTVKVNVHQEKASEFKWQQKTTPEWLAGMQSLRALPCGDRMFVFGSADGSTGAIYSSSLENGNEWTAVTPDISEPLPADIHENVVVKDDLLYVKVGNKLFRSSNGENWEEVGDFSHRQLVGSSVNQLFALGNDNLLYASSDNGVSWTVETLDDQAALLPTTAVNLVAAPLVTDESSERIIMAGNRDVTVYPDDDKAVVWVKIRQSESVEDSWMLLTPAKNYALPRMNHLAMVPYANGLLALGAEGVGACDQIAFSKFFFSLDGGLSWQTDSRFTLPSGFASGSVFTMTVDSNHFIWLFCSESGQVWRGRLNKEGWQKEEKAVTE